MAGFVLCGEGPTDLFYDAEHQCQGPLKDSVDQLLLHFWDSESHFHFKQVSRGELSVSVGKGKPEKKSAIVRGAKNKFPERRWIMVTAKCLAEKAMALTSQADNTDLSDWGVIYFHDLDKPSGSDIDSAYADYIAAMHDGFDSVSFKYGVPMIPKTRSESWILCVLNPEKCKENKYYENLPMSDKSPKAGQIVLAQEQKTSKRGSYKQIGRKYNQFDWISLESPSFVFFKNRLHVVSAALLCKKFPDGKNFENTKVPT